MLVALVDRVILAKEHTLETSCGLAGPAIIDTSHLSLRLHRAETRLQRATLCLSFGHLARAVRAC